MIDIHTHILPGIDDGAANEEQALQMARAAVADGIHTLIATPHHYNGKYTNPGAMVRERVQALNALLQANGVDVQVLPGQEVRLNRELLDELQSGVTIGLHDTTYVLLELPSSDVPSYTEEMLHELLLMGRIPIIAHPERNAVLASDTEQLSRLIEAGALAQLTSHSINGVYGRKLQKLCFTWCKQGLIQFVSSDAHNVEHRAFHLRQAYEAVREQCGSDMTDYLMGNAERLVAGELVRVRTAAVASGRKWWKLWG
ncbi:tyrosine-protein phosphatase [Paenibacillus sp. YYML68]|uniref:tyrosine-protein phosphatase n=1 Tax=Paenibacillus sp. YYML68 TaxID=2909250 RepID=UPI00249148B2|nr:CpsB/CapC family capsule biosynthesis tyrosine phosphatase [Paenibacillus sp. YYML68]